ncbi:MAG: N-6 DNA methylase [Chloroflexota bacterium]|nr:N-6 DNA methylase [Chloroflexota bacterium]
MSFVVENKAPNETTGHNQLVSYVFLTSANGAVWFNGNKSRWFRRYSVPEQRLVPWPGIPRHGEVWDAVGRRGRDQLQPLIDVRGTLERCHNKMHRRGSEGDDLTMDMVRILLAKARDEERDDQPLLFYCTPEEYGSDEGQQAAADRVQRLFEEVRDANPTVFEPTERIRVGSRQVAEVVVELQDYRLIGDDDTQWDVMGAAYEQYTAEVLKREGGEFFTNRLVIRLLTRMIDPHPDHLMLDPAGGTGGFCTATIRHMRSVIRGSTASEAVKRRRMDQIRDRLFYIDVKHRLVKIAKAAMILTGNGHRGFTQGDSLAPFDRLPSDFTSRCQPGTLDRVLTNPPFAGTTNGKISAPSEMVPQFELARRWQWENGDYVPTADAVSGGVPPELLFIERCIQWLKPGGLMGIVVPKGVIENPDVTLATRHFMFRHTFVRAIVACHKNTFQPYTGSRTALLVLEKKTPAQVGCRDPDYPIFMALSRKIGQDSEGVPIFVKDEQGRSTDKLDHDLDDIYSSWEEHLQGHLKSSEYTFSVGRSSLNPRTLLISPQSFLPSLNESIADVLILGESDDFTVMPLGELCDKIYKGTRFRREDLETEDAEGSNIVRYYTPAALLQDRADSVKFLDLSRADARRRAEIQKHLLRRLDLLVTRSGTVGRVIMVTADQAGHVGSDDLIHVDIPDESLRAYVYQFLKSDLGQKQMKKNEYGTIQQHLEPAHIREVLIPVPTDASRISQVAQHVLEAVNTKEQSMTEERQARNLLTAMTDRNHAP